MLYLPVWPLPLITAFISISTALIIVRSLVRVHFNFDRFYQTGVINMSEDEMYKFTSIKYRPKDNDYFTDCKVSPIVDVLNLNQN